MRPACPRRPSVRTKTTTASAEAAEAGLVDGIDLATIPVLLGGGIQLLPSPGPRLTLQLRKHRLYPATGTLGLEYDVGRDSNPSRTEAV